MTSCAHDHDHDHTTTTTQPQGLVIALFGALFGGMIELVLPPLLVLGRSVVGSGRHAARRHIVTS